MPRGASGRARDDARLGSRGAGGPPARRRRHGAGRASRRARGGAGPDQARIRAGSAALPDEDRDAARVGARRPAAASARGGGLRVGGPGRERRARVPRGGGGSPPAGASRPRTAGRRAAHRGRSDRRGSGDLQASARRGGQTGAALDSRYDLLGHRLPGRVGAAGKWQEGRLGSGSARRIAYGSTPCTRQPGD